MCYSMRNSESYLPIVTADLVLRGVDGDDEDPIAELNGVSMIGILVRIVPSSPKKSFLLNSESSVRWAKSTCRLLFRIATSPSLLSQSVARGSVYQSQILHTRESQPNGLCDCYSMHRPMDGLVSLDLPQACLTEHLI